MSLQQSKAEKNDAAPVRRAGGGGKSGASAAAHPPKGGVGGPSPHNASNTSGKRQNGPGGQSRGNPNAGVSHSNAYAKVQNGGITQRQQTGSTSATSGSFPISTVKQSSVVGPKSNGILPKPPIAQPSNSKASEQTSSSSTAAVLGESTRAMAQQPLFQFGSFSPTGINGLQVRARTSSAPPNFDEQKRDQAHSGPPVDVSVSKTSTLSGTVQQLEGPTVLKQVASTIETTSEGNKILQGPKASPPFVQSQDATGGQIPSALPLRSNYPPSSQIQSHGATSGSRVTSSHPQSHGMAPVPRASSSHMQSQGAPSGPHAPSSQMQSQGVATEPHAPSYKYQSQGAISVPRGQSPQMQPQGGPHGLHGLSSQLQSQVLTTGLYAPNSQLQSQGVAPGSRSLQVQLQMPQVHQQVFSSQGLTAGALHSQGMLHHGLGYTQTLRHIIPQQTHVPSQQFIHTNHQINGQIPIKVTGSVGAHLPSYGPATQANQSVPQRTNPVKITHPETHEEIKIGPNVVKSDSHADGGIGTLVSDGCLPGGPPQYGTPHSGSVSISGLPQMSFYPTVSSARVAEKESKSSLNAFSNNKITNTADVPKTVGNKKKKKLKITNTADVPKTVGNKKKKKLKDCLSKADAAAPTGDLYNAYKVPEKEEDVNFAEPCKEDSTDVEEKPSLKETQKHVPNEVDDWEDAAELSTNIEQVVLPMTDSNCSGDRKYSRDFLLTFKEHFKDLPLQFEMCQDFGDSLINCQLISSNYSEGEPLTSTGRGPEYSRLDRHGSNVSSMDEDRWLKPMDAGSHDLRVEMGLGAPGGFRPGQGYNTGFGKNMRGAAPGVGPSGQFVQAPFGQSGPMRNNIADVDRWRTCCMQKGLIPPPIIHKTDNRYEVGKVSDEEESKQRKIKSILNKLTPQNFETLFLRVQEVNIDSAVCLAGVISQIFDKALMEPTFCEMYAIFCVHLAVGLPEFYEDNERVMFRRVLVNKCQEEFERDEREQAEAEMPEDGEIKVSKEEREGKRSAQRRRMLALLSQWWLLIGL